MILKFTYDRDFRQSIDAPSLPEEVIEQAYVQFASTGLDPSEWLTWLAQFTQVYLKNAMPICPKCSTTVLHEETLLRRGTHGDDPKARHRIFCPGCSTLFADYSDLPGISLSTIQESVSKVVK